MGDKYDQNAEVFAVFANAKRLAVLHMMEKNEVSLEEMVRKLKIPKTNLSQHLSQLRHLHIVRSRREGVRVFYRLTDPKILKACDVFFAFNKKYRLR